MSTHLIRLLLCLALTPCAAAAATPTRVAVVVGANEGLTSGSTLRFAHRDADQMAATLADVSGFAPGHIKVLKDPQPEELLARLRRQSSSSAFSTPVMEAGGPERKVSYRLAPSSSPSPDCSPLKALRSFHRARAWSRPMNQMHSEARSSPTT